ncbi:IclR family transcriptional regulator [Actinomadura barringtoniae]|uniref:IclR family transcriptional regulator n=1 Tax=Actinomadura barringtoniae TaxID=1427535 RepID=A0A939PA66_9ACTN|nr:IclR family transcriptional regulator [Actinomadura barringtoniae]MBO2448785.1 IclR family transcriptional regulator [Actinomadura barringtoniae]
MTHADQAGARGHVQPLQQARARAQAQAQARRQVQAEQPPQAGRGVLEGAFSLLDAVARCGGEAGLTALAVECGLPKTTAYRLLEQLVELGAVERSGRGYRIGPRIFRLGQGFQPHPGLKAAAAGPSRALARATGATVGICVLSQGRALVVDGVPGELDELASMRPGATWPWSTAAGKVLVAGSGPRVPLDPIPRGWAREAAAIRERGAALDHQELIEGVCCVAVPVRAPGGATVAVLSALVAPGPRMASLTQAVMRTGRSIDARLSARRRNGIS